MVTIKKIDWLDKPTLEAIATITDGVYELECFSHPCNYKPNQIFKECIYSLNSKGIVKNFDESYFVHKQGEDFSYEITGQLKDINRGMVQVGDLIIEIEKEYIPGDIKNGDYINFCTTRLDIY